MFTEGCLLSSRNLLCSHVTATLFAPLSLPLPVAPSPCNTYHSIVLVLSVNCEQILMSPQFYSALAAFACHLPACKDTQLAIIPSLSPPRLITVLFLSLPPFFSHLSRYFLIFSASWKKKKFILSFCFSIIWQSHSYLLLSFLYHLRLCCPVSKVVHFLLQHTIRFILHICAHIVQPLHHSAANGAA